MMSATGRAAFAVELTGLRTRAGLSLAQPARAAVVNRGYLGHLEHGQRWPSRTIAAALDDALTAGGALLDTWAAGQAAPPPPPVRASEPPDDGALSLPVDEWTAPDAAELADRLAASGDEVLTAAAAHRLAHEWLVAEPPQSVQVSAGRRIGAGMVDTVARRVGQLRRVDDYLAGRDLRPLSV